ncbi:hypothetical protein J6590_003582 [Homalodisca vitripennis]|nr:hypothetical protein J6590_003582 [Homalodisca vitripennis]
MTAATAGQQLWRTGGGISELMTINVSAHTRANVLERDEVRSCGRFRPVAYTASGESSLPHFHLGDAFIDSRRTSEGQLKIVSVPRRCHSDVGRA